MGINEGSSGGWEQFWYHSDGQEPMENWMYQFLKVNTLAQCIHVEDIYICLTGRIPLNKGLKG